MTKSITGKVLTLAGVIIAISVSIFSAFTYHYFYGVFSDAVIKSDVNTLSQQTALLNSIIAKITDMANSIIIHPKVQTYCLNPNAREDYLFIWDTNEELKSLFRFKEFVKSIVLSVDGKTLWSEYPIDDFYQKQMQKDWYLQLKNDSSHFGFSVPYTAVYSSSKQYRMITFKSEIHNVYNPGGEIGELLVNIDFDALSTQLELWGKQFSGYMLFDGENILYEQNTAGWKDDFFAAFAAQADTDAQNSGACKVRTGSAFWSRCPNYSWTLVACTSNETLNKRLSYLILIFSIFTPTLILLILLTLYPALYNLTKPITVLANGMKSFSPGKHDVKLDIKTGDELEDLSETFNYMVERINSDMQQQIADEKLKRKMKFDLLMSKIHPHFMYNTLNSIVYLARKANNQEIVSMTHSLIFIFQDSMAVHKDQIQDTVQKEADVVKAYCTIQSYRYKNKFTVDYDIDKEVLQMLIPKNILQPLVENSLFHGISPLDRPGHIHVAVQPHASHLLYINVSDDGAGMDATRLANLMNASANNKPRDTLHSIGLKSIRERLEFLYGQNYTFEIYSKPSEGTQIEIQIPVSAAVPYNNMEEI